MLLAHGIGGVEGLPLDGELVLQTGGVVVLVSFLSVALLWTRPRFTGPVTGRPLPAALDAPGLRTALRAGTLLLAAGIVGYGFLGPQDPDTNPAPRALYVLLWVGVIPVSLLLGPVWRVLNPLRLLHRIAAAALRRPVGGSAPLPAGYRFAAAGLLVFAWLELVAPWRDRPAVVAGFLLGYAVLHTVARCASARAGSTGATPSRPTRRWRVCSRRSAASTTAGSACATRCVPSPRSSPRRGCVTLLLVEGPRGIAQLAGQELGAITAVPSPWFVAGVQIGAVLLGHVAAVVAAHDRSVALLPAHRRLADQVPLVGLMVAYTVAGLFLLVIS